ncbi:MAG: hypothetical protein H9536_11075 [Aphanizomenon flos-aquae Clear-A1]|jgi:uncharacterized membrane protein|uniref:Uncharacterized protein n=1 Tax=Aphanizomenon flos-aquae WA102 TaxID=1710896 RepID=A0A1B7X4K7_APHFL|nr:hypothetical protein [Aphanizomenon flos-aquae Clear-A1]OBQ20882.1 MAG: hypothetical protein AN488_11540 [Anabaena sp. WA113]OBQ44301.1 MAG: hypothetical protein AN484_07880 [Aphanizomenon flos-aquae WA102]
MSESIPNFLTSIAATSLVIIWFIHTGLLIGFDKKYKKYISKVTLWFNKRPIVLPSIIVLMSPFLFTYLALPQFELTGLFKQIFSIFTFILGVIVTRSKEEKSSKNNKQKAFINAINENNSNIEILKYNLETIENNCNRPLKTLKTEYLNLIIDNIPQENLSKFASRHRAITILLDTFNDFNNFIESNNSQQFLDERKSLLPQILYLLKTLPDLLLPTVMKIV